MTPTYEARQRITGDGWTDWQVLARHDIDWMQENCERMPQKFQMRVVGGITRDTLAFALKSSGYTAGHRDSFEALCLLLTVKI